MDTHDIASTALIYFPDGVEHFPDGGRVLIRNGDRSLDLNHLSGSTYTCDRNGPGEHSSTTLATHEELVCELGELAEVRD